MRIVAVRGLVIRIACVLFATLVSVPVFSAERGAAVGYVATIPCRTVDTRDGTGGYEGRLPNATPVNLSIEGICDFPPEALALILDVTVVDATSGGSLALFAKGQEEDGATISFGPGETRTTVIVSFAPPVESLSSKTAGRAAVTSSQKGRTEIGAKGLIALATFPSGADGPQLVLDGDAYLALAPPPREAPPGCSILWAGVIKLPVYNLKESPKVDRLEGQNATNHPSLELEVLLPRAVVVTQGREKIEARALLPFKDEFLSEVGARLFDGFRAPPPPVGAPAGATGFYEAYEVFVVVRDPLQYPGGVRVTGELPRDSKTLTITASDRP